MVLIIGDLSLNVAVATESMWMTMLGTKCASFGKFLTELFEAHYYQMAIVNKMQFL